MLMTASFFICRRFHRIVIGDTKKYKLGYSILYLELKICFVDTIFLKSEAKNRHGIRSVRSQLGFFYSKQNIAYGVGCTFLTYSGVVLPLGFLDFLFLF